MESLLNRSIGASIKASAAAGRLNRTSLRIDVEGLSSIRAAVAADRLALSSGDGVHADAVISGSPISLLKLLAGGAAAAGAQTGAAPDTERAPVRIAGDAEIAARYRELFALARPDWEEELSRLVGDLPARRLSLLASGALSFAARVRRTAGENLAEYLTEESRDLVSKPELEEFLLGVDQMRETADRVDARLARLEQHLKAKA
ncbi:MAG: sterol-binding protein [Steroidobacteraceae bacterium]